MLSEIPGLGVLILSTPSYCDWRMLLHEEREYFPQIFATCKCLQYIDISIDPVARTYQRWFRDGSAPRDIVELDEVLLPCWNIS